MGDASCAYVFNIWRHFSYIMLELVSLSQTHIKGDRMRTQQSIQKLSEQHLSGKRRRGDDDHEGFKMKHLLMSSFFGDSTRLEQWKMLFLHLKLYTLQTDMATKMYF